MPITINGSGTVTGISAGGLPDGVITTDDLASTVPVAKAWVNFNGTGTVAIRASYNVSSITDNNTGDYTVNFTTALADANYAAVVSAESGGSQDNRYGNTEAVTTTSYRLTTRAAVQSVIGALADVIYIRVAIFR